MNCELKYLSVALLVIVFIGSFYLNSQQIQAKPTIPSHSKIVQDLKKKVAILLAPCAHVGNSTNPVNLLQCQAAMNELESFVGTASAEIAGIKGAINQILRNIH